MKAIRIGEQACMVELGPALVDHDEEPIVKACAEAAPRNLRFIILDFSGVQRMNGLGTSLLVKLAVRARRNRQRLMAIGLHDHQPMFSRSPDSIG